MSNTPDDFDERARAAGEALRQAAPPDGLRRIRAARRNRRIAQAGGAAALAVLGIGVVVALTRGGDDTIVTTDPTTVPRTTPSNVPTSTPTTVATPPTSTPDVVPPTEPGAPMSTPTTEPLDSALPATVWIGGKLAGWYDAGRFVAFDAGAVPDGLVGSTVDVVGLDGSPRTATVADEHCSAPYLTPTPDTWGLFATAGASVGAVPFEFTGNPSDVTAALSAAGADPNASVGVDVPTAGGEPLRLVLVDGWNAGGFQFPTWIATWDGTELATIEGDPDPANSLDIGTPLEAFYDLDGDSDVEIVFAVGDGWGVQEIGSGDTIVFGAGHPCPEFRPEGGLRASDLAGVWSLDQGGEPAALVEFDGAGTTIRYGDTCWDQLDGADGQFSLLRRGECFPGGSHPGLADLASAQLTAASSDVISVVPSDGEPFNLFLLPGPPGLDLAWGSVAGVRASTVAPVDVMIARLTAVLGEPDLDTGWFTTPPNPDPEEPDCLASMDTRTLWWGDLAVSLWPSRGVEEGVGELWDITLGAQPSELRLPAGMTYTPEASGLRTNEGIGIGTPLDALPAGLNWYAYLDGTQEALFDDRPPLFRGNNVTFRADPDAITEISVTRSFC